MDLSPLLVRLSLLGLAVRHQHALVYKTPLTSLVNDFQGNIILLMCLLGQKQYL